ncbi:MAG: hypothetical protein HY898_29405 [Deltaproteobacteria bacterium]|nr:hypothetical protein [Deltaproteobacteria bacterium]
MPLDFLNGTGAKKNVRTTLYGDQEFTQWELEILHTPVLQRLYNLKQLGFADRVFPDAVHSRINHVIGVAEVAERMATRLAVWLGRNETKSFAYALNQTNGAGWTISSISGAELAERVRRMIPVVRLMGLLHDLTHAAFGHTLEDEVCVFQEKHDDPARQIRFFDALVAQLLYLWTTELGIHAPDPDMFDALAHLEIPKEVTRWAEEVAATLGDKRHPLAKLLRELECAFSLLIQIEFLHSSGQDHSPDVPPLLVSAVVRTLDGELPPCDVVLHRDAFFVDIVGNTICADLLDYARRDPGNAALRVQFDDRLIRYVCAVSVKDGLSPTRQPCVRLALQFFTDKMRHDVLSEMSGILKARYLINERVLFHPTKCAAGAMLGTAVQLLGMASLPVWLQVLGDQEFIRMLVDLGERLAEELTTSHPAPSARAGAIGRAATRREELVQDCLSHILAEARSASDAVEIAKGRVTGARLLLWHLQSRRFHKLVFRLRPGVMHSGGANDETIANTYVDPARRFALEREVERTCHIPFGAVVIHCPKRKMSMKVAQALVVGADLTKVAHLRDVNSVSPESLEPYSDEIQAVERMYKSIWQFHAYLDPIHEAKRTLVAEVLRRCIGFPNDKLLSERLADGDVGNPYGLLAGDLNDSFAWNLLPDIIHQIDIGATIRMRHGEGESARERTTRVIRDITRQSMTGAQEQVPNDKQLTIPGVKPSDSEKV